jgi:hypothetical protein
MAPTRRNSRGVCAASVPPVCEVCREGLVTTLIVDFIFARKPCAERISIALSHGPEERALRGRVSLLIAKRHSFLLRNCERDSATLARQERNT